MTAGNGNVPGPFGPEPAVPHKFHRKQPVTRALRAIALSEIAVATEAIAGAAGKEPEVVHDVRRQLKRLRALIRLPHHKLAGYRRENQAFRDLGRRIAGAREAEVLARTYAGMVRRSGLDLPDAVRDELIAGRAHANAGTTFPDALTGDVVAGLASSADRIRRWRFDRTGFALLGAGARRTYRRMRRAGLEARLETSAANLHEWRKLVKYHAAQLQLLSPAAADMLAPRRLIADRLADVLGEHHDLDQLRTALGGVALADDQRRRLIAAIETRCTELEAEAFQLGDELAADDPKELELRLAAHWRAWRR
jgi:CHAD domain